MGRGVLFIGRKLQTLRTCPRVGRTSPGRVLLTCPRPCPIRNERFAYNRVMPRTRKPLTVTPDVRPRVIGYVRVSTDRQAESGAGIEAQKAAIAQECDRRGLDLVRIVEEAASGKSLAKRPGLVGALNDLAEGQADVLMAAKLDRLSRSVKDFADIVDMGNRYRWSLIVLDVAVDTTTPAGEMLAGVMVQFAQFERRMIGVRTREALAVKRAQGVTLGRPVLIEAETAERIGIMRAEGLSMGRIAETLNAEGVPTANGGAAWYASTVSRVLGRAAA